MAAIQLLFVPYQDATDVSIFSSILTHLRNGGTSLSCHALSLDQFVGGTAEESLRKANIGFTSIRNPMGGNSGWHRFKRQANLRRQIRKAFRILQPDLVILADDVHFIMQQIVKIAKKAGVPVLLIQDRLHGRGTARNGVVENRRPHRFGKVLLHNMPKVTNGHVREHGSAGCDRICVMGESSRRRLIHLGVQPDSIRITGQPRYDHIRSLPHGFELQQEDSHQRHTILFLSQPLSSQGDFSTFYEDQMLESVIKVVHELGDSFELLIKLHSSEPENRYHHILRRLGGHQITTTKYISLEECLGESCLVLGAPSDRVLEAILFRLPIITLNYLGSPDDIPYAEAGAALSIQKPDKLKQAVLDALCHAVLRKRISNGQEQFLREQLYRLDGKACQRVADVIRELIN